MKLSDFDIVYISLERRPEKRRFIEGQLQRLGLLERAHYFSAIDGQTLSKPIQDYYLSRFKTMAKKRERILGRIGCYLSHLCVLQSAIESGVENLLILEDDCRFLKDSIDIPDPPQDAEIFYLGGLFWTQEPETPNEIAKKSQLPWIRIHRKHVKLACTLSYGMVGSSNIRKVFDKVRYVRPSAIDLLYINFVQKNREDKSQAGHCYVVNQVRCVQVNDFGSDVTFMGTDNPEKPYKNSYFYTPQQEQLLMNSVI